MITCDFKKCYEISCDFCSTGYEEINSEDWDDMLAQLKEKGWKNFKKDGEWQNECPDCIGSEFDKI